MSGRENEAKSRLLSLAPQFLTQDLESATSFYTDQLGFRELFQFEGFYAAVARDGVVLHLKHSDEPDPGHAFKRQHEHLDVYITTDDVDGICREFQERGVALTQPIHDTAWGTREFVVEDRDGYLLYFGQPK